MICSNCGANLLDGAKFCVNCGNAVAETPVAEVPVEEVSNDMQPTLVNDEVMTETQTETSNYQPEQSTATFTQTDPLQESTSQQAQYSEPIPTPAPAPAQGMNPQMPIAGGVTMGAATAGMAAGAPMYNAMYQAQPVSNVKPPKKINEQYTKVLGIGGHLLNILFLIIIPSVIMIAVRFFCSSQIQKGEMSFSKSQDIMVWALIGAAAFSLIFLLIWAFGGSNRKNRINIARGILLSILFIAIFYMVYYYVVTVIEYKYDFKEYFKFLGNLLEYQWEFIKGIL